MVIKLLKKAFLLSQIALIISVIGVSGFFLCDYLLYRLPADTYQDSLTDGWGALNIRLMKATSTQDFTHIQSRLYKTLADKRFQTSPVPYYLLASLFEAQGDYPKAKKTYQAMLQVADLDWFNAHIYQHYKHDAAASLALIEYRERNDKQAKLYLAEVPDLAMHDALGTFDALQGVLDQPERSDMHYTLGKAFRSRLELPEARQEFEKALAQCSDPNLKLEIENILFAKMPKYTQKLNPKARYYALAASNLEDQAIQENDLKKRNKLYQKTIPLYKEVLRLSPDFDWGYQQLAHVYMESQNYPNARHYAQQALAYNPNLYLSRLSLGDMALADGEYSQAEYHFSQAQQILAGLVDSYHQPLLVNVENQLGFVHELLRQPSEAKQYYQAAIAIGERFDTADTEDLAYAQQALERLEKQTLANQSDNLSNIIASKHP